MISKIKSATKDPVIKYILIGGGIYLSYKLIKGFFNPPSDIDTLTNQGMKPTYTDGVYMNLADSIESACDGIGTDEQVIYQVMSKMKNDLDVAKLIAAYGKRRLEYTLVWGTLSYTLTDELDQSELNQVNSILAKNGIKYKF